MSCAAADDATAVSCAVRFYATDAVVFAFCLHSGRDVMTSLLFPLSVLLVLLVLFTLRCFNCQLFLFLLPVCLLLLLLVLHMQAT